MGSANFVKAISVRGYGGFANYDELIHDALKSIETRVWTTNYRGDLLICSSKSSKSRFAGKAVCVVELYDITDFELEHELDACCQVELYKGKKSYAWHLRNLRHLSRNFDVKGKLSMYEVSFPDDVYLIEPEKGFYHG